jgi:hypothetical protein
MKLLPICSSNLLVHKVQFCTFSAILTNANQFLPSSLLTSADVSNEADDRFGIAHDDVSKGMRSSRAFGQDEVECSFRWPSEYSWINYDAFTRL